MTANKKTNAHDHIKHYDALLTELRACYDKYPALRHFAPLPDHFARQELTPITNLSHTLLMQDKALQATELAALQSALLDASHSMAWRTIYTAPEGAANQDLYAFSSKLGCYAITGDDSPFASLSVRIFLVYMPAGLYYPWHKHPAEELYFGISGSAIFRRDGAEDEVLTEGKSLFHESDQPHAIETTDQPFLSLAIWRNHLTTPPTLLDRPK